MIVKQIDYKNTGYFSDLVIDYLSDHPSLKPFYHLPFEKESFARLIEARSFRPAMRKTLADTLLSQYKQGSIDLLQFPKVKENITLLENDSTYTITTGHQLCLFTGPLYFIYKIFSVINLCEELTRLHPGKNFVPVYWMATEDHDFEEINHFHLFGKRWTWEQDQKGATGHIPTASLKNLFDELVKVFGESQQGKKLSGLFERAYLGHQKLSDATRFLVNELYQQYGLVCLDPDARALKQEFKSVMRSDIQENLAFRMVKETNELLGKQYKIQVNPRKINLFYLAPGSRERIVKNEENGRFQLSESGKTFEANDLLDELENHPERFSPNVILRPVYQELILPNLAYIGGGGEISYWLQLKSVFDHYRVQFPVLVLRNSVLWVDSTSLKKLKKNHLAAVENVFKPLDELLADFANTASSIDLSLEKERESLEAVFTELDRKVKTVDQSLVSFVKAERQKSINVLNDLRSRLTRAAKKNNETGVKQLESVKERLFPNNGLQERHDHFAAMYITQGDRFFNALKENLDPFTRKFIILTEEQA